MADDEVIRRLQTDVNELRESVVEHRVRLENGTKVFSGWERRMTNVEANTKPKEPPSTIRVVAVTISGLALVIAAFWWLAMMLLSRPTTNQVEKIINGHDTGGHSAQQEVIRLMQSEQVEQRTMIHQVREQQREQGGKLDDILERLPKRRRRNR
jgi:hypothetical protein